MKLMIGKNMMMKTGLFDRITRASEKLVLIRR